MDITLSQLLHILMVLLLVFPQPVQAKRENHFAHLQSSTLTLTTAAQLGGVSETVALQGNYAYVGRGNRLWVVDVSSAAQPELVGELRLEGPSVQVKDIQISGSLAYVAAQQGLRIVDISTPSAPVLRGSLDISGSAEGVAVQGGYAYLMEGNQGIAVVDISIPATPQLYSTLPLSGWAQKGYLDGSLLYVACGTGGLRVVSISAPQLPTEVGSYVPANGDIRNVALTGSTAYVIDSGSVDENGALRIVDFTLLTSPVQLRSIPVNWAWQVIFSGNLAYLAASSSVYTFDITDPTNPLQENQLYTDLDNRDIAIQGGRLYLASWSVPLQIMDLSIPARPAMVGKLSTLGWQATDVTVVGDRAYVAGGLYGGVQIVDITDPVHPSILGVYRPQQWFWYNSISVAGNFVYLVTNVNSHDLIVINVSDPAHPIEVASIPLTADGSRVRVVGDYLYVAESDYGLEIFDVSDPTAPQSLGRLDTPGNANSLAVAGSLVLVADGSGGLRIISVAVPSSPVEVGSYQAADGDILGVDVRGTRAYLAKSSGALEILNIADPAQPTSLTGLSTGGSAQDVILEGDFAYVAAGWGGVVVLDISVPGAPVLADHLDTPGDAKQALPAGGNVYVADGDNGLMVLGATYTPAFSLSGRVTNAEGQPVADVTLHGHKGYGVLTNANGEYTFSNLPGGDLTVVPEQKGKTFTPAFRSVALAANLTGQDFQASSLDYSITGQVRDENGAPLAGVTVSAGAGRLAQSGPDGQYVLSGLPLGSYTVAASAPGRAFSMPHRLTLWTNATQKDFVPAVELAETSFQGGSYYAKPAVLGMYAYVARGNQLEIYSLVDPAHPVWVSQTGPLPGAIVDLKMLVQYGKTFALLATDRIDLLVYDVSDPAHPNRYGFWDGANGSANVPHLALYGAYGYVATHEGLYIVDLSRPSQPSEVGWVPYSSWNYVVAVSDQRLYIVGPNAALNVYDLADPASPALVGQLDVAEDVQDIAVQGKQVFLNCDGSGLRIMDVSNPASPAQVGIYPSTGSGRILVSENRVYFSDSAGILSVVDVSSPGSPQLVGSYPLEGMNGWTRLVQSGAMLYGSFYPGSFQALTVTSLPPVQSSIVTSVGTITAVAVSASEAYAYAGAENQGLVVYDLADPLHPHQSGSLPLSGYVNAVTSQGTTVYLAMGGLQIVDVADPARPVKRGAFDPGDRGYWYAAVVGNYAYLWEHNALQLDVMDVSNPAALVEAGSYAPNGTIFTSLSAVDGFLYATCHGGILQILSLNSPASPTLAGQFQDPYERSGLAVAVEGKTAYFLVEGGILYTLDISDPAAPRETGRFQIPGNPSQMVKSGSALFILENGAAGWLVDVHNPLRPVAAGRYFVRGSMDGMAASSRALYLASGFNGLVTLSYGPAVEAAVGLHITPQTQLATQSGPVWIEGHHFQMGAQVFLSGPALQASAAEMPVDAMVWGENYLQVSLPAELAPGAYDLTITNADGRETDLARAFTVLEDAAPTITAVSPARGRHDLPNPVEISGAAFAPGAVVTLMPGAIALERVTYTDSQHLSATVPAGLAPQGYDLVVTNPDGASGALASAYTVLDARTLEDLYAFTLDLDLDPETVRYPSPGPQMVQMTLRRQGGVSTLNNVQIDFYQGDPAQGGKLIGSGTAATLEQNASTLSTQVAWTVPNIGTFTLYAVMDPLHAVAETDEGNNVVSRSVTVLPNLSDFTPPQVSAVTIDLGAAVTIDAVVQVDTTAADSGAGMGSLLFIEYAFNQSLNTWVAQHTSPWLPYEAARSSYPLVLSTAPGLHYVQVWAADRAGNISAQPALVAINYLPLVEHVSTGQVILYRQAIPASQPVTLTLTSLAGDADLYAWHPDGSSAGLSETSAPVETVAFHSVGGLYQFEVEGFAAGDYRLSLYGSAPSPLAVGGEPDPQRPRRSAYNNAVPLPGPDTGVPSAPADFYQIFLTVAWR